MRTGAAALLDALIDLGVDTVFGYPGGAVLPIYDALNAEPRLRHVLVRHEQAAVHAAQGYARSTGRVGVVLVTSGPGMSNTTTGLLDALCDLPCAPERVVLASSANVYGNNPHSPVAEDATPAPLNHYAASKLALEMMARNYQQRLYR
mgnify:CR=1 FL=1